MQHTALRTLFQVSSSVALVGLLTACGGKVTFETGSGGAGGTTSATTGKGGVTASGVTTNVTGTGVTTNVSGSVVSGSVSGSGSTMTSGSSMTSGSAMTSGSVSPVGSTGSGSNVTVFCNGGPCNPGEVCCFNPNGPGDHCGQNGMCDPGFIELQCNSPNDCPGQICCAQFDQMSQQYQGIACQNSCSGPGEITVCSQNNQGVCPMGTQCHQSMQLGAGYRICF